MARLVSIQYLRAVVALMVVLHHLPVQLQRLGYTVHWPELFNSRVDLFFVLSGFIIWVATANRTTSIKDFMLRRLLRIVPLYWLATVLIVVMMLAVPGAVQSGRPDLLHIITSFMFLPAIHPTQGYIAPVLIPGWTLAYEVFFYVVFALCLPLAPRQRLAAVAATLSALVAFGPLLTASAGPFATPAEFYTSSILLEFALGLAVGAIYTSGQQLSRTTCAMLAALGLAGMVFGPTAATHLPRLIIFGVPAALLLAALVFNERQRQVPTWEPAVALGDASYALFISHGIVLSALARLWHKLGMNSLSAFVVVSLAVCVGVALLLHRYVEKPITRHLQDLLRRRAATQIPSAAPIHAVP